MSRYAVIALAVAVGAAIGIILARRKARAETTLVEEGQTHSILPWIAGLAVLMAGLFLLADHQRSPVDSEYRPAKVEDGVIRPGGFDGGKPSGDGE